MDRVDQIIHPWNPTPLGARVALALARVLEPLDAERSMFLRDHAQDLAVSIGEETNDLNAIPLLFADEEWLIEGYLQGCETAAEQADFLELHPPTVWRGTWNMDCDGVCETRASVAQSSAGYLPGLEVSQRGGDCEPSYWEPMSDLEGAIRLALERESNWHSNEPPDDAPAAGEQDARWNAAARAL